MANSLQSKASPYRDAERMGIRVKDKKYSRIIHDQFTLKQKP